MAYWNPKTKQWQETSVFGQEKEKKKYLNPNTQQWQETSVMSQIANSKKDKRTWFKKSEGNFFQTILGTGGDVTEQGTSGILGMGEKIVDTAMMFADSMYLGNLAQSGTVITAEHHDTARKMREDATEFVKKDLYNEQEIAKKIIADPLKNNLGIDTEAHSVLGKKSEGLVQSAGQLGATALLSPIVPWWLTTGATSFGAESENALNQGATYEQAVGSAMISAGAEILTEKLSGGISFGGRTLDDAYLRPLTEKITNKVVKRLTNLGLDAVGEGTEEVITSVISNLGTALYKEESVGELLGSEEALDEYLESFIGGAVLGGVSNAFTGGNKGLTENEQKVVDAEIEKRVQEYTKDGKRYTEEAKEKIEKEVYNDLARGNIDIDSIERTLGTFDDYDALSKESEEYTKLYETPFEKLSKKDQDRLAELEKKNSEKSYKDLLAEQRKKISEDVQKSIEKDARLHESYNEKARRGQKYQVDATKKYSEKEMEIINKAVEYGELNNTRKAHEFVDLVAKLSADKGVSFDFTNNQKLKDSGFAIEGKTINGFKQGDSITVNLQSKNALNTVVGHEITHVLEGTELYRELQNSVIEYAKQTGVYDAKKKDIVHLYRNQFQDNDLNKRQELYNAEITADLVGEYIFSDTEFVRNLSTKNQNVFQKVFDEIKYMLKKANAGSEAERQLLKAKKIFEDVYRETNTNTSGDRQFSVSEVKDTKGRTLTKEQQEKFKDSVVRDENGNLKPVYHGSESMAFTEFNMDKGVWLSETQSYSEVYAGQWHSWRDDFDDAPVRKDINGLEKEVYSDEDLRIYELYADIKNPFDIGEINGTLSDGKVSELANKLGHYVADKTGDMKQGGKVAREVRQLAKDYIGEKAYNFTRTKEFMDYAKSLGFDGFEATEDGKKTYAVFNSADQLKLTTNAKPTNNSDIRFSLSKDTEGKQLTPNQQKYFKDSKVRDNNGRLKVVYHSTDSNFYVFDKNKIGSGNGSANFGKGFYFSTDEDLSRNYGGNTEKYYLNIKKLYDYYSTDKDYIVGMLEKSGVEYDKEFVDNYDFDYMFDADFIDDFLSVALKGKDAYKEFSNMVQKAGYDGIWADNEIIAFEPNQIKIVSNENPTSNEDIRYSLTKENQDIAPRTSNNIYAEDIALEGTQETPKGTQEATEIAPTNSNVQLENVVYDTEDYAPLTEEQANEFVNSDEEWERMRTLQEVDEPLEVDEPIYSSDTASLTKEDLRKVRKGLKDIFEFKRGSIEKLDDVIQRYAVSEHPNRYAIADELRENWGTITEQVEIQDVVEVQNFLKATPINVSPNIKQGVTDYVQTMRKNFNKIKFSKDGIDVDVAYQEMSNVYPDLFPAEITNDIDQFERIVEVANMVRTEQNTMRVDDETIDNMVNKIIEGIRDVRMEKMKNISERNSRYFDKDRLIEEYMQTDDYSDLAGNPNLLNVFHARWDRNQLTDTPKEATTNVNTLEYISEAEGKEKTFKEKMQRKWAVFKMNFVDKGAVFEDLSKATKNRLLEAKWDYTMLSSAQAQHFMQNGGGGVKSLKDIRESVNNSGFAKEFDDYMYNLLNIDRMTLDARYGIENKTVYNESVTADVSKKRVSEYESAHPEFKNFAKDVYDYMSYLREQMVHEGILTRETADLWAEMYPHYVPIKRVNKDSESLKKEVETMKYIAENKRKGINAPIKKATGGTTAFEPLFDTIGQRTMQTFKAINKNDFGIELKDTLASVVSEEHQSTDNAIDMVETQDALLQEGKDGRNPTFTVFENGKKVTFEITQEMFEAMSPISDKMRDSGIETLQKASAFHRGVLTQYNPVFALTNGIKDAQDILINSQHPLKTYGKIVEATQQLVKKGEWYREYMKFGGEDNSYFDTETHEFAPTRKGIAKALDTFPLKKIAELNDFIERVPRLAEYIASREMGRSIQESMLDASRVTTNFKAGGDVTKFLNKNGATFLNASVQGATQQVRNVREANMNGLKGWGMLATKFAVAGLPALLLNHLLWDDDEEYEELSDYVKQNYYVVGKYGDGQFIRIPKGRTIAVIQDAVTQIDNMATGNDEADLKKFLDLLVTNLAPNNPIDNNVIAPIVQTINNKTWYGEDLVPQNLQDMPSAEQYDESTDKMSRAIGKALNISPMKVNYLMDQYTGLVGDMILPMMTPEVTSNSEGAGMLIAPLKDKFTTDGVMNKQVITDFYSKSEELTTNASKGNATSEDVLKNKYLNSVKSEMNALYKQKREIQNSDMSKSEKYDAVREVQKQISALAEKGMNNYEKVEVYSNYGKVDDKHFRLNDDGEWQKINGQQLGKQEKVTEKLGITPNDYWSNKDEYDFAYDNAGKYGIAKTVGGYDVFKEYTSALGTIKGDKNIYGETISGSRKTKVVTYINSLNADYYTKILLLKNEYPSDDRYNAEIIEYLNNRNDVSYQEMVDILTELGFYVSKDGTVSWD
jgi:hypothetical protein